MTRKRDEKSELGLYCEVISYPSTSSFFELDVHLLSLYPPKESPKIRVITTPNTGKSTSLEMETKIFSTKDPDPWLWRWYYRVNISGPSIGPGDNVEVIIVVSNEKGTDTFKMDIPLQPSPKEKVLEPNAPRLICAINSTPVRKTNGNGGPDAPTVERILTHIWKRLNRPMEDVWLGPDSGLGLIDLYSPNTYGFPDKWTQIEILEEMWARQFSEMLLCVPYSSFAPAYSLGGDNLVYQKMEGKRGDRAFPLVAACQHLATMAVISRGICLSGYLTAGYESVDTVGKSNWFEKETKVQGLIGAKQDSNSSVNPGKKPDLQAGSFFLFCHNRKGKGESNVLGDHIAPILRIKRSPLGNKLQLFDTGAMGCRKIPDPDVLPGTPGQYDDPLVKEIKGPLWFQKNEAIDPLYGCGSVPVPEDLINAIENMVDAVPLGMVRLVLMQEGKILFSTPVFLWIRNVYK